MRSSSLRKIPPDLHLGEPGRLYGELAASWLWVITGDGLVLWFGRRRVQRKLRGTSGRRRTLSLHGSVGVWAAAGLSFLSATGLTWSTYAGASVSDLREAIGQMTPTVTTSLSSGGGENAGHAEHAGHQGSGSAAGAKGGDVGLDAVLKAARAPA